MIVADVPSGELGERPDRAHEEWLTYVLAGSSGASACMRVPKWQSLLQHPSSPPVRKEYHQWFGRRWIYVVGDSGDITAGSRTVGDVHPSPPVRIWNRW